MLRLFFYFHGQLLKVRKARADELMERPCHFGGIEFQITPSADYVMMWTSLLPDLTPPEARSLVELVGARYPFSPRHQELKKVCSDILFKSGEEWVFFGGSFNPWHAGHQACLSLMSEDKMTFVIPDRNPYKDLRSLDPVAAILELSSKVRFKKNQFLVPTFLLDDKKNPTVDWIERLHQDLPDKKLSLLIGYDSFMQIKDWTRSTDLLTNLHKLYVVSRLESDLMRETTASPLRKMAPHLEIEFLGHHAYEHISSTDIRKKPK